VFNTNGFFLLLSFLNVWVKLNHMARILLIEDNPDQAFVASRFLERAGFAVAHQSTAATGLESAKSGEFDLIMLDYGLPDSDGLSVLEQLIPLGVPVVLVTGRSEAQLAVKALQAGAANYIVKDSHYLGKLPEIAKDTLARISVRPMMLEKRQISSLDSLEQFRYSVRQALSPMVQHFKERILETSFSDAVTELENTLESAEAVLDEELEALDQLLYEELSKALQPQA
jgi:CheY-like chemotaxis protein